MKQIPLPIGAGAASTFHDFAPGANAATLAHLRALKPGAAPVYLWGPSGCGKTHLLRATLYQAQIEGVACASFGARVAPPWECDDGWRMIALDDCERLNAEQQHSAFALFVHAATHGATIVAAGRLPPVDLPLRDDLRTRLGWGHVMALQPLSENDARAALRREADRRGIVLADEVIEYLLTRFARDLKSLFDLLERLDGFSLSLKRSVTVPLLKQMLAEEQLSPGRSEDSCSPHGPRSGPCGAVGADVVLRGRGSTYKAGA